MRGHEFVKRRVQAEWNALIGDLKPQAKALLPSADGDELDALAVAFFRLPGRRRAHLRRLCRLLERVAQ